jgi:CRISPR/Cas system-associated exonuclease Cas4 (RecB family)
MSFRAIIDFYGEHAESGEKWAIDWKTGRPDPEKMSGYIKQLRRYAAVLRYRGYQVDKAAIYFVQTGQPVIVSIGEYEVEDEFISVMRQTARMLTMREYPPSGLENPKDACNLCQFPVLCRMTEVEKNSPEEPVFKMEE